MGTSIVAINYIQDKIFNILNINIIFIIHLLTLFNIIKINSLFL